MTDRDSTPADPLIGTRIGNYRVARKLGEGGMGAVYELLHPTIGKRLALKLLKPEFAAKPRIVQRFFDEARAVNLIGHPNIVDVIDFGELPGGGYYFNMEFLPGESLADYLRRVKTLPGDDIAAIAGPICSALSAAHEVGIVHRDLKPANIHLVPRPTNPRFVKVLDFGIAKLGGGASTGPATASNVVMGTPHYMAPEQAMGRSRQIDARSDIYSLGIILYQMCTGRLPFHAEAFGDLLLKHLQERPRPLSAFRDDLSSAWDDVVQVALAKRREDRFQSMAEMGEAIAEARQGRAPTRRPVHERVTAVAGDGAAGPAGSVEPPDSVARADTLDASSAADPETMPSKRSAMQAAGAAPEAAPNGALGALGAIDAADAMNVAMDAGASAVAGPGGQDRPVHAAPSRAPSHPVGGYVPPPYGEPFPRPRRVPRALVPIAVTCIALATIAAIVLIVSSRRHDAAARADLDAGADAGSPAGVAAAPPDAAIPDAAIPDAAAPDAPPPDAGPPDARPKREAPPKPRGTATLIVASTPWANVYINGQKRGETPIKLAIPAGRRLKVRLQNPEQGIDKTWTITARPGQTIKRELTK